MAPLRKTIPLLLLLALPELVSCLPRPPHPSDSDWTALQERQDCDSLAPSLGGIGDGAEGCGIFGGDSSDEESSDESDNESDDESDDDDFIEVPIEVPEVIPEVPEEIPEGIPDEIPGETPEEIPEDIPDNIPDDPNQPVQEAIESSWCSADGACGDICAYFQPEPGTPVDSAPVAKRTPVPEHQSRILTEDFYGQEQDPAQRDLWYYEAFQLVQRYSAQNAVVPGPNGIDRGISSSKLWDIANMDRPFITGGGPSWGCTTLIIMSDVGIWLAHFWEWDIFIQQNINEALNFISQGSNINEFPSLPSVAEQYFGLNARFVRAYIYTPSVGLGPRGIGNTPFWPEPRPGLQPTDPWHWRDVDTIAQHVTSILPNQPSEDGLTLQPVIPQVLTYTMVPWMDELVFANGTQDLGLIVVQYAPRRFVRVGNQCSYARSLRILHPKDQQVRPISWPTTPYVPFINSPGTDLEPCPADADERINAQNPPSVNDENIDPNQYIWID